MHPLDKANELYAKAGINFTQDLAFHLRNGYVFSDPEHFLMGFPVILANPNTIARPGEAEAWHVRLAIGQGALGWFLRQMPWFLPFVCWHRTLKNSKGALHVWPSEILMKRLRTPYVHGR